MCWSRVKHILGFFQIWLITSQKNLTIIFSQSVQSLSHVRLFVTPWTAAHQASLSITNSQSLLKPCPSSLWSHNISWIQLNSYRAPPGLPEELDFHYNPHIQFFQWFWLFSFIYLTVKLFWFSIEVDVVQITSDLFFINIEKILSQSDLRLQIFVGFPGNEQFWKMVF